MSFILFLLFFLRLNLGQTFLFLIRGYLLVLYLGFDL